MELNRASVEGEVIKGKGIPATVGHHQLIVGNRKLIEKENILLSEEVTFYTVMKEKEGNTTIIIAIDGSIRCFFHCRPNPGRCSMGAGRLAQKWRKKMVMLTGDNHHTAELVASRLGLNEFHAELLPEQKVEFIKQLQQDGDIVAMAGDGINDAPAIATADIGFAMRKGGTDISMETADVLLMADKLYLLSQAYSLAKATIRNIKQNTFFAVGIVGVLLTGVLTSNIHLASGMFIHEASVLIVILNAIRLLRFRQIHKEKTITLKPAEV